MLDLKTKSMSDRLGMYKEISRRSFLKAALAVGAALTLAGCADTKVEGDPTSVSQSSTVTESGTLSEPTVIQDPNAVPAMLTGPSYILPDYTRCVGCNKCMIACSLEHFGVDDANLSNIQVYAMNFNGAYVDIPVLCMKCRDNPCISVCPEKVQALTLNETTGAVQIDHDKCTLCGLCIDACNEQRTGCLHLNRAGDRIVGFCDMCDGTPACAYVCPDNVLQIVSKSSSIDGKYFAKKAEVIGQQIWNLLYAVE